jgi:hypothetical protein
VRTLKKLVVLGALAAAGLVGGVNAATFNVNRNASTGATTPVLGDFAPSFASYANKVGYGNTAVNRMYMDSIPLKCDAPQRITSASLTIEVVKLSQGANRGDNDSISLWATPTQYFGSYLWTPAEVPGTTKVLTYNFASLPPVGAGTQGTNIGGNPFPGGNMLPTLQLMQHISLAVQDDTTVRRVDVTYNCEGRVAAPGGVVLDAAAVTGIPVAVATTGTSTSPGFIPKYGVTPLPLSNPNCGPWKICFAVDVPNGPGDIVQPKQGTAQLMMTIMQNGNFVQTLQSPTLNADGTYCFDIPQNASYLNLALGGFDYMVTANFNMPATAASPGTSLPSQTIGSRPQGTVQGMNNDITLCAVPPADGNASTCCPPLVGSQVRDFFTQTAHPSGAGYNMVLNPSSPAYTNFVNGYQAYLTLLKFVCPSVVALKVTFTPHTAASIGGAFTSNLPTPFSVNVSSSGAVAGAGFGFQFQPNTIYGISAETVGVNAQGQPVNCGFDKACNVGDRFTYSWSIGNRVANPGAGGTSPLATGN